MEAVPGYLSFPVLALVASSVALLIGACTADRIIHLVRLSSLDNKRVSGDEEAWKAGEKR